MKIIETVRGLVESKVNELGYRVYDIDFGKEPEGYVLTIYIDAESPITLDDCEKVSRAVEPVLDEADPITQPYYLSVSSIGLDRPLTIDEDFKRNLGKQIDIKLYAPLDLDKGAYNAKGGKAAKKPRGFGKQCNFKKGGAYFGNKEEKNLGFYSYRCRCSFNAALNIC